MVNKRMRYTKKRKDKTILLTSVIMLGIVSLGITLSAYGFQKNRNKKEEKESNEIVYNPALTETQKKVAQNLIKELDKLEINSNNELDKNEDENISEIKEEIKANNEVIKNDEVIEEVATKNEVVEASTKPNKKVKFIKPVNGTVSLDYSADKVVYLKTLDEWGIHLGIDYLADIGADVKAGADGIIQKIYEDNEFGVSIVIEHGNGLTSRYSCVSDSNFVKVGDEVKQGDVIAKIARTVGIERDEGNHLHFEVLQDDVNIKPIFE